MILLLDNYDSFTWNVWQALAGLGAAVEVVRNDAASAAELLARAPAGIVLSPGPGRPAQAGVMPELLRRAPPALPVLGICLGHQALVEGCGGALERDPVPVHGRASPVHHARSDLLEDLPSPFAAGRYHSLRARRDALPACLELTAWTGEGHVMAVRHRELPRFGVQFHPESILSPQGSCIFERFLRLCAA
jgi:anthranilate synthase/aminodeoxychorismate synthase-like glutamine amidotransferase